MNIQKFRKQLNAATLVCVLAAVPMSCMAFVRSTQIDRTTPAEFVPHRAEAGIVAHAWLSGVLSPFPVDTETTDETLGRGTAATALGTQIVWQNAKPLDDTTEQHEFVAVLADGSAVTVTINLIVNPGVTVADTPSVRPKPRTKPVSPKPAAEPEWDGAHTQDAQRQFQAWANAYADNDIDTLYRITGDTELRRYVGLGGYKADQVTVLGSVYNPGLDLALVTIRVKFVSKTDPTVMFDSSFVLRVGPVSRPQPPISNWGAPGEDVTFPYTVGVDPAIEEATTTVSTTSTTSTPPTTTTTTTAGSTS